MRSFWTIAATIGLAIGLAFGLLSAAGWSGAIPHLLEIGLGVLAFVAYIAPCLVAARRRHPHDNAILALNFFLGWTFVGWLAALLWALSGGETRRPTASDDRLEA